MLRCVKLHLDKPVFIFDGTMLEWSSLGVDGLERTGCAAAVPVRQWGWGASSSLCPCQKQRHWLNRGEALTGRATGWEWRMVPESKRRYGAYRRGRKWEGRRIMIRSAKKQAHNKKTTGNQRRQGWVTERGGWRFCKMMKKKKKSEGEWVVDRQGNRQKVKERERTSERQGEGQVEKER